MQGWHTGTAGRPGRPTLYDLYSTARQSRHRLARYTAKSNALPSQLRHPISRCRHWRDMNGVEVTTDRRKARKVRSRTIRTVISSKLSVQSISHLSHLPSSSATVRVPQAHRPSNASSTSISTPVQSSSPKIQRPVRVPAYRTLTRSPLSHPPHDTARTPSGAASNSAPSSPGPRCRTS